MPLKISDWNIYMIFGDTYSIFNQIAFYKVRPCKIRMLKSLFSICFFDLTSNHVPPNSFISNISYFPIYIIWCGAISVNNKEPKLHVVAK